MDPGQAVARISPESLDADWAMWTLLVTAVRVEMVHGMSHGGAVRARLDLTGKSRLRVWPRGHRVLGDFLHIIGTETRITTQNSLRDQLTWGKRGGLMSL